MAASFLGTIDNAKVGWELSPDDQRRVKAAFVHRYTGDHIPKWAVNAPDLIYPVQFKDDNDWLAHTFFAVRKDGSWNPRVSTCEAHPTWPNGKSVAMKQLDAMVAQ